MSARRSNSASTVQLANMECEMTRIYRRKGLIWCAGTGIHFTNGPSLWHRWQRHMENMIYIALYNAGLGDGEAR